MQGDRFLVQHGDQTIAVKEDNLVIFDEGKKVEEFTDGGKQHFKQCHPDKGGDRAVFTLLRALL